MRKLVVALFAALLFAGPAMSAAHQLPPMPDLTADAKARLAPLVDAYAKLNTEFTAAPAKDDASRLLRLKQRDEIGRALIQQINFAGLPEADARALAMAAQLTIEAQDIENQKQLKAILPKRGWFLRSEVGAEAVSAAWLVIHHATNTDIDLVRAALASMKTLLPSGEIEKFDYAMLSDRVAVVDGVRQTYGTQMICHEFKWMLYPVEDQAGVEQRRKEMGIGVTLADQLAQFAPRSCPVAQYQGPLPK